MRRIIVLLWLVILSFEMAMGSPMEKSQTIPSRSLGVNRTFRVYIPQSYEKEPNRRYPVLYLHDGQNVFSSAGTNIAFGWGSWELDKTVGELCRARKMQEVILVAVDNSVARYEEYCGRVSSSQRGVSTNAPLERRTTMFENYAAFLITELKPRIDQEYRTKSGPSNTGLMGSSLGGVCSVVLAWEHPEIFGCAASLSGAFQVEQTNFLNNVLGQFQGKAKPIRVYLDSGTIDFTGGDDGRVLTERVVKELRRIGWGKELMHYLDTRLLTKAELEKTGLRRDKWDEAQTSQHNEFYWRLRSWRALTFLFPTVEE